MDKSELYQHNSDEFPSILALYVGYFNVFVLWYQAFIVFSYWASAKTTQVYKWWKDNKTRKGSF